MSSIRFSSEATPPDVSVKVSVTMAWTTVPDGTPGASLTVRCPTAVPPAGGSVAGMAVLVLVAASGSAAMPTPASGSPATATGTCSSSGRTKA